MAATLHRNNWEQYAAICEAEIERLQKTIGELASNRIENERLQAVILRAENIFSSLASAARDENMYNLAKICADYESEMRGAYEQEVKTK